MRAIIPFEAAPSQLLILLTIKLDSSVVAPKFAE